MAEHTMSYERPRAEWADLKEFFDEATGALVRVRKLPLAQPKYCIEIGVRFRDKPGRFIAVTPRVEEGWVTRVDLGAADIDVLALLLESARDLIEKDAQEAEDRFAERARQRQGRRPR